MCWYWQLSDVLPTCLINCIFAGLSNCRLQRRTRSLNKRFPLDDPIYTHLILVTSFSFTSLRIYCLGDFLQALTRQNVSIMYKPQTVGSAKHEFRIGRLALQLWTAAYRGISTRLSKPLVILRALFKRDIWQFGAESVPRDIPVLSCGKSSVSSS